MGPRLNLDAVEKIKILSSIANSAIPTALSQLQSVQLITPNIPVSIPCSQQKQNFLLAPNILLPSIISGTDANICTAVVVALYNSRL
jgi:hypothetical protein